MVSGDNSGKDQNKDPLSSTLHAGGIKALLDKANKGHDFVFPPELCLYLASWERVSGFLNIGWTGSRI